ncbi:hypothetical protein B8V81_2726 [Paenibacillus pasadenensis]|uniref:Uncharacterized protein n=1 Tax=Paenibacillus pasadenensis TaxID=217090 RepID=A0A2N5N1U7_9BACL|nr:MULTISPECIES: hypothetical protein [Paenibacillus]PLT44295.1 hypothetical protein B8V81_2726 [Paenibacillus pasadenensis]QGG54809.1 hypothetical protein GE073_03880 [Paenibacillus sp. B01]
MDKSLNLTSCQSTIQRLYARNKTPVISGFNLFTSLPSSASIKKEAPSEEDASFSFPTLQPFAVGSGFSFASIASIASIRGDFFGGILSCRFAYNVYYGY